MLAALGVVGLTLVPSPIPAWLGRVVAPTLLGGVLLGVGWVYLTGPFGLGPGAQASLVGAVALVAGGALAAVSEAAREDRRKD
jgi:hypothetical protein